ncbi:hypothetical protein EV356DRAFT_535179 [Viridothelium virens]|uniref:Uncharacterized protein n=1 Tax=Viridothelium virens TaxID=1048519 RepID=A0A6A6H1D7_VIRVR|nr:hypothetical protein EV356DRAFT_535179 [Viridothelium virens]
MSDYGEDDYDDYDLDYEYIYVEDEFGAADDLAEHAIASPPYTFFEYEVEQHDYDPYDYFNDIEYTSDGYFDDVAENGKMATPSRLQQKKNDASNAPSTKTGQKRKAATAVPHSQHTPKKARMAHQEALEEELPPTVVWVPWNERPGIVGYSRESKEIATSKPFALLADWRDRIGKFKPSAGRSAVVTELQVPDHGEDEDAEEDVDQEAYGGNDVDSEDEDADIDEGALQENLKKALGDKLAASGMDQNTLLQYAMRMLSGEGDSDDIAGELANNLLGRATEGPEAEGISQWLGQQGVNLEEDGEGEEDGEVNGEVDWQSEKDHVTDTKTTTVASSPPTLTSTRRPPTPASTQSSSGSGTRSWPAQSVEPQTVPQFPNPVVPAIRGGTSTPKPSATKSRKRKAEAPQQRGPEDLDDEPVDQPPPAKRVASYAAPTASSKNKATAEPVKPKARSAGRRS